MTCLDSTFGLARKLLTRCNAWRTRGQSLVIGLCGSQGSGKSTLAAALAQEARRSGMATAVVSLDDLYLPSRERQHLATRVHPLLGTRGPPGTHDVELGISLLGRLATCAPNAITKLPRFDKLYDERVRPEAWPDFVGRADLIIFEGWCVGASPQTEVALAQPANALERELDKDRRWRSYVNAQLAGPYTRLFAMAHHLIMLKAPSFDVVFAWRRQQEHELAQRTGGTAMSDAELARFIACYERLTRHILEDLPQRADIVISLDEERRVLAVS